MPKGKHGNHRKGGQHYRWNGGALTSSQGYRLIRVGIAHPAADFNGYSYEHLVVWLAAGRPMPAAGEVLHHVNGNRCDNRIENLHLLARAEHNALHNAERERDERGRFIGKKRAGRLLDGREWNEYPKE